MHGRPLLVLLLLTGCLESSQSEPDAPNPSPSSAPDVAAEAIRLHTDIGSITILLYPAAAPRTVDLMKTLVREGYYDGREFNRVVPGHVIQLVDKAGGVTDDPLRRVPVETNANYHFSAGAAGIARAEDPNSGGPEFFLMDFATSHLDGNYTVWGQTIDGLDVIHRAARVPAIESNRIPGAGLVLADRTAIQAVKILRAEVVNVNLPADAAAQYPLVVAQNVRSGNYRHSLEWPADLAEGAKRVLTWYVLGFNDSPVPDASQVAIRVEGQRYPATGGPAASGVYHWAWAPPSSGDFDATFMSGEDEWATLQIHVLS